MKEETLLNRAYEYAEHFQIFPLAPLSTIPLKGSRGYKDATTDSNQIEQWFSTHESKYPKNLGFSLANSNVFVLDIDMKNGKNGVESIKNIPGYEKIGNTPVVKTPNNGFHIYFQTDEKLTTQQEWMPGIDLLTMQIVAPGSCKKISNGMIKEYRLVSGDFQHIEKAPEWLMNAIIKNHSKKPKISIKYQTSLRKKTYVAEMLEEIVEGASDGNRNVWLARQTGKLLAVGMSVEDAHKFIRVINQNFVYPPLLQQEVDTIFKSILKIEIKNRKGAH